MTDMNATTADFSTVSARISPFGVEDVFWGYKIGSGHGVPLSVMAGQAICFFFGVCLMTATFGLLLLPALFFDGGVGIMRLGAATLMGAAAFYLLWFASRGTLPEIHIDTRQNEIRQVVCNRSGKPTTVATYTFDEIGGIFLEPDTQTGQSLLLLGYLDTDQTIAVATGTEAQLLPLRDRLARDLLGADVMLRAEAA
ncbi:hypothetical protein BC777_1011 [Yoonia maricola]|uniref:Uncharacterized protein n=1 Tax=Yoonia maricola TaxID=420999 RepID=A0A2M8WMK4_9RHOB|nr:hypothetical protein [Yoonia maricola]PJI92167.1 hypothetical protein BC777_1011 [Yoonia maricola]